MPPPRFPILERDDGFDGLEDNAAYFTCRTAPYAWLDDEEFGEESSLQRPIKNAHFQRWGLFLITAGQVIGIHDDIYSLLYTT